MIIKINEFSSLHILIPLYLTKPQELASDDDLRSTF